MPYDIIVAVNKNRGIGYKGLIPWKPDHYFLKKTIGKTLLVGKNTILPQTVSRYDRRIIVADRNIKISNAHNCPIHYVIGGQAIYESYINGARYIHMVNINDDSPTDKSFPEIPKHFVLYKTKSGYENNYESVYIYKNMAVDFSYLKLCQRILCFGPQTNHISFDIKKLGENVYLVPFINSKKLFLRGVIEELLFFLCGETDTKLLEARGVNIWKGNTSRDALDKRGLYNYSVGEAGPIYGAQWVKQIPEIITELQNNPLSRRAIFTAWIPNEIKKMCLPPCHMSYQLLIKNGMLNINMYQRSADVFLGLPFNLASCAFLYIIFSEFLYLKPGQITIFIGDAHIYKEHFNAINTQMNQNIHIPAVVSFKKNTESEILSYFKKIKSTDFDFIYISSESIKAPLIVN